MDVTSSRPAAATDAHEGLSFRAFVTLVACLMAINALSIDIMLPALPAIGDGLGVVDDNSRQLVLGAYLVSFGAAQLFWGPLADRFGRRPTLLVGLALFMGASAVATLAPTFEMLLAARAAQGLAAASTRVVAVALVRDCYDGREMGRVMSLVMMVFMIVPILAPAVGQLVLLAFSWRWIFMLLFVSSGALLVWCVLALPETMSASGRRPLLLRPLLDAYGETLSHRMTLGYTLALGVIFGALFGFLTSAQQVFQEIYGLGGWFVLAFAATAALMAAASFLNATLVRRIGMRPLSHGALLAFTAVSLLHLALALTGEVPFWAFFTLLSTTLMLFGFIGANFNAMAMEPMGHIAGTAASVVGFTQTFMGAVLGSLAGLAYDGTIVPLMIAYALLGALCLVIVAIIERGRLMRPHPR